MPDITYKISHLHTPINGVYNYRLNRIIKERGKPMIIKEIQLCKDLDEAEAALATFQNQT